MRKIPLRYAKWLLVAFCISLNGYNCESQTQTWSKPEQSISSQNNDWIPVQGKCLTCRPSRDLDAQSTNEQINRVLSPPLPDSPSLPPPSAQPVQFINNKQPRILPFGPNFGQYNSPLLNNNNKQYQLQATKLFPQEQKQFFQYENVPFVKQPFSLPPQQLIQQSPSPQQRFPVNEPYPFTLPLKPVDVTTPKIAYQPKIRFPDSDLPKLISNNKITSQNNDEIQLLYVPVETLQRGRKNMKDLLNQNQYQQPLPHGFVSPQYNLQYSPIPKIPENQYFLPPNFAPAANFLQLNPFVQPKVPETVYANISKNFLQPYFTINGLYTTIPQVQPVPTKQPDLQFYNIVQPGLINPNQVKVPEQQFKTPQELTRPLNKFEYNNLPPQGGFVFSNANDIRNIQNQVSTFADVYSATTPEVTRSTQYTAAEKTAYQNRHPENKYKDFDYQYVTINPQTSASQNQQYFADQSIVTPPKPVQQADFNQKASSVKLPQTNASPPQSTYDDLSHYPIPHQPPLSFYMEKLHNSKINDVLYLLKDAKTIPVLDTVENEPPQVFVGPSELQPPKGYIKFELPYLSSLDYNRIERMIDKLPFFVAPLNFKPPPGYSKIPFPAPHIGSVVLSNSSTIQESIHDKPYDQKYKPSSQSYASPFELSTNAPQLTSQINSLFDVPSSIPVEPISYKNFAPVSTSTNSEQITFRQYTPQVNENVTKKPMLKSTTKIIHTTEQPKRVTNRQRKPIYRGYPTTTESTTRQFTSTTESVPKFQSESTKDTENYVEFAAKGKFNINNDNRNVLPSNPPIVENTFQPQLTSSTYQPVNESNKNNFDFSNYFASFGSQNSQIQDSQFQNGNSFQVSKQTSTQDGEYYSGNNQNYPFYSSQKPNEFKTEERLEQNNKTEPEAITEPNVNFSNVKPLSQYNPFSKKEEIPVTITEPAVISSTNQQTLNDFQFWNQNQFYNVNPSTIDYFSSTAGYQPEESSTASDITKTKISTTTYVPEYSYVSTDVQKLEQNSEYSSTESTEKTTTNSYRPRIKQRINGNRYHQSRYTTEKENTDDQSHVNVVDKVNLRNPSSAEHSFESSTHSDMVPHSTEYQEFPTRNGIKPHRRRNRPVTSSTSPVTEISSSTSRSFRTRATRYPVASTEKYRFRRPTTSAATTAENVNLEWGSYVNNFAPSAPATNEIVLPIDNKPRVNAVEDNNYHKSEDVHHFWTDTVSGHQSQAFETNPTTQAVIKNISEESSTETSQWADLPKPNLLPEEYSHYTPTGQSQQFLIEEPASENKTERIVDRKDDTNQFDVNNSFSSSSISNSFEGINDTFNTENYKDSSNGDSGFQKEKTYDQEAKKEKFLTKEGVDTQKKAYDPQDEKKLPIGRRRGTWVRRIRIKRPQDVFETAESQNLGRITDNSLQTSDSKTLSKAEEKDPIPKVTPRSVSDDFVTPTEIVTEKVEIKTTTSQDDYANLQNNFAQMLSDFLNSNEKSAKTVNNIERYNTTENSISFILGLNNNDKTENVNDSSSPNTFVTNSPTENTVTNVEEVITVTSFPSSNTEFSEHQTTTDQFIDTVVPNKVIATSTTTEISLETEICYRGKCVKTKKSKASDLLPVE